MDLWSEVEKKSLLKDGKRMTDTPIIFHGQREVYLRHSCPGTGHRQPGDNDAPLSMACSSCEVGAHWRGAAADAEVGCEKV